MSGRIFWLASYPKSGNTWVRVWLTNYLGERDEPADINDLDGGPIASSRHLFDRMTGIESSDLSHDEADAMRPDVYRDRAGDTDNTLFVKAHDAYGSVSNGEPHFPPDVTAGVIYILRNPLDLAISFANHMGHTIPQAIRNLADPDFALSGPTTHMADQLRQRLSSWSGHVLSWTQQTRSPVCVVRYEDLRADPIAEFTRVAQFAQLDNDPKRMKTAVAHASFETLRAQEASAGFRERPLKSSAFFRKGQVGEWRTALTPAQIKRVVRAHSAVMRQFGYLADDGTILT